MTGVAYTVDGDLGLITLDRPPANAYDAAMMAALGEAIDAAEADARARVVVIRSSSDEFFCGGADVSALVVNDLDAGMDLVLATHGALARIAPATKVFIAWIAGHALSGGLEIALACDLRYGADGDYRLGSLEVLLGLLPSGGGTQRLPRLIGRGPALELLLTARQIGPDEARRLGLLGELFAGEQSFREHAERLAELPPLALSDLKRAVHVGSEIGLDLGLALERDLVERLLGTREAAESLAASSDDRR
jgi:enoyl-CoA hydratase/carnithine racemase